MSRTYLLHIRAVEPPASTVASLWGASGVPVL